jgi:hypothetical protein
MKKVFLVTAASLFIIGQALAQAQAPAPTGTSTNPPNATQSKNTKAPAPTGTPTNAAQTNQGDKTVGAKTSDAKPKSSRHMSSKRSGHHMARSHGRHHRHMAHGNRHRHMAHTGMKQGPQTVGFGPQQQRSMKCKKGQKPDGITCM